ncbi:MAG: ABC transporter ATP-binding protein, partial [Lachnospiraceae bacterium]|nr:ABC transporter ATP-binding protein [Lachnospiraceae bacterium]
MDERRKERLVKKYAYTAVEQPKRGMPGPGPKGGRGRNMGPMGKPKNAKETLSRLFAYLKKDTWKLVLVFACVITSAAASLAGSYMLRPIINTYIAPENGAGRGDAAGLIGALAVMGTVYLIGVLANYIQHRVMIGVSQGALNALRKDLFDKMQRLPVRFFDTNNHGDVMSRFTNDVDTIGEMMNNTIIQLISGSITLIGTLCLMIYTNIWLTLVTIVMVPLLMKAGQFVTSRSRKYYKAQQAALGTLNGYVEEMVTGQKVVKVFCHEDMAVEEFEYLNYDLRDKQIKAQFFGGIMGPVMGNLSQVGYALTAAIGGILCVV